MNRIYWSYMKPEWFLAIKSKQCRTCSIINQFEWRFLLDGKGEKGGGWAQGDTGKMVARFPWRIARVRHEYIREAVPHRCHSSGKAVDAGIVGVAPTSWECPCNPGLEGSGVLLTSRSTLVSNLDTATTSMARPWRRSMRLISSSRR